MSTTPYNNSFFEDYSDVSYSSALVFASLICDQFEIERVIDLGCGNGTWLKAFSDAGVDRVTGVDGPYLDRSTLLIQPDDFTAADLSSPIGLRERVAGDFDLAISVEVAEHLPRHAADSFVDALTRLAPLVLFSAAIPHQGGTEHVNEQWPNYWATLFANRGYLAFDWLRPRVWGNPTVAYWYAQNALFYVREDRVEGLPQTVRQSIVQADDPQLSRVHPRKWTETHDLTRLSKHDVIVALKNATKNAVNRRLGRLP